MSGRHEQIVHSIHQLFIIICISHTIHARIVCIIHPETYASIQITSFGFPIKYEIL